MNAFLRYVERHVGWWRPNHIRILRGVITPVGLGLLFPLLWWLTTRLLIPDAVAYRKACMFSAWCAGATTLLLAFQAVGNVDRTPLLKTTRLLLGLVVPMIALFGGLLFGGPTDGSDQLVGNVAQAGEESAEASASPDVTDVRPDGLTGGEQADIKVLFTAEPLNNGWRFSDNQVNVTFDRAAAEPTMFLINATYMDEWSCRATNSPVPYQTLPLEYQTRSSASWHRLRLGASHYWPGLDARIIEVRRDHERRAVDSNYCYVTLDSTVSRKESNEVILRTERLIPAGQVLVWGVVPLVIGDCDLDSQVTVIWRHGDKTAPSDTHFIGAAPQVGFLGPDGDWSQIVTHHCYQSECVFNVDLDTVEAGSKLCLGIPEGFGDAYVFVNWRIR